MDALPAVFAGISALAAVFTAWLARRSLTAAMEDSAEASRPFVVCEFVSNPLRDDRMIFAVVNYGRGVARDVELTFAPDPLLIPDDPRPAKASRRLVDRWKRPLAVLPPGGQARNVYYLLDHQRGGNIEPLPDSFEVTVSYRANRGGKPYTYTDHFVLDLGHWFDETRSVETTRGAEAKRSTAALEAIARGIGRYS